MLSEHKLWEMHWKGVRLEGGNGFPTSLSNNLQLQGASLTILCSDSSDYFEVGLWPKLTQSEWISGLLLEASLLWAFMKQILWSSVRLCGEAIRPRNIIPSVAVVTLYLVLLYLALPPEVRATPRRGRMVKKWSQRPDDFLNLWIKPCLKLYFSVLRGTAVHIFLKPVSVEFPVLQYRKIPNIQRNIGSDRESLYSTPRSLGLIFLELITSSKSLTFFYQVSQCSSLDRHILNPKLP